MEIGEERQVHKLSVIIPVYNAEKTLIRCIESIFFQTNTNWEIWLIDDGSVDSSGVICDRYSEQDSRVHVIHKKNEGVSSARNMGIENAIGEYVMFVDSDDYLEKNALEVLMNSAERNEADLVMCGFFYHSEENGEVIPNHISEIFVGDNERFIPNYFREAFGKELLNPPWNKVVRRSLLIERDIRFVSEFSICEDMIFTMDIIKNSKKIVFLNLSLYHYIYKRGDNLVNRFHANFFEALSNYYNCLRGYLDMNSASVEAYLDIDRFLIDKTISYLKKIYSYALYDKLMKYRELKRICDDLKTRGVFRGYKPIGVKKKVVSMCIRYKLYWLLHFLYLIT